MAKHKRHPLHQNKAKPSHDLEIVAAVVVVAIIVVAMLLSFGVVEVPNQQQVPDGLTNNTGTTCAELNPGMTEEDCLNVEYMQRAIEENDIGICDKITDDDKKESCKRYFGYKRWD